MLSDADISRILSRRQLWLTAFLLALSNFTVALDMTVANVSIPHIAGSLGVSNSQGSWVITSYAVAEAITVPLTGWLAQRFGAIRMYLFCMTGFGVFSFLCGISVTLQMLILSRIGQGLCGGLLMPLSQTLLLTIFTGSDRPKAMLLAAMTTLLGPALGPTVGGFISDNFSWHWVFLINLPIVAACVLTVFGLLYVFNTPGQKVRIDLVGLVLLIVWVGSLQYMLDIGREHDWFSDPLIVMLAIVSAVGFCAFVIWELTEEHPIVDLRIFRYGGFTFGVIAMALCFGAYFASIVVIPQWLQTTMGYPAVWAGFITSCTALAAITTSALAARTAARGVDPRLMISLAVGWIACMSLLRSNWTSGADFATVMMPQVLQGFAMSFFMLPLTIVTLNSVRPEETASATGIQNFTRTLFSGMSTAIVLTVWANSQQTAQADLAGRVNVEEAMRSAANAGMSQDQGLAMLMNLVNREAATMAIDYVFLASTLVFAICATVIWLAPRPRGGYAGTATGGH